jgi:hypothetical protein
LNRSSGITVAASTPGCFASAVSSWTIMNKFLSVSNWLVATDG